MRKANKMSEKKEIIWGMIWGLGAGLLFSLMLFSIGQSAPAEDGNIVSVSISSDSVTIIVEKNDEQRIITVAKEAIARSDSGVTVDDRVIIEGGKIIVDGVEISEKDLDRLSVDSEEKRAEISVEFGDRDTRTIRRKRLTTVYQDSDNDVVKFGDVVVDDNMSVRGDAVSLAGDVTVYGEVDGDVVAVFGDVFLRDKSRIYGDVEAPFGKIMEGDSVYIAGKKSTSIKVTRNRHEGSFGMGLRYDRVEGLFLEPSLKYESVFGEYPTLELTGGYAFSLKRWEYDFRVDHKFGHNWGPKFSGSMYQTVQTSDYWMIPWQEENTIAAVILKEDFLDYYWMRGFTGGGGLWYGDHLNLGAFYTGAKIDVLDKRTDRAIFGGKKKFRENWSTILPDSSAILGSKGNLKEIVLGMTYDTRDDKYNSTRGILADLHLSQAMDSDSADFKYKKADVEFKWYYPLTHDQTIAFRARGGFSDDDLPLFRRYFIGGIGSLRGYKYKEFEGNRYVLFNADYIWRFIDSDFGAGLFFDIGKAGFNKEGFDSADFKSDVGISFIVSDVFRIDMAQRLDDLNKSPVFSIRGKILL